MKTLLEKLQKAWCKETAHPAYQEKWSEDNPAIGQCAVTALIVQEKLGGDIMACKVGRSSHFVNVIDGAIVDLTLSQFGENAKYVDNSFQYRTAKSLLRNKDVRERYEILKSRM